MKLPCFIDRPYRAKLKAPKHHLLPFPSPIEASRLRQWPLASPIEAPRLHLSPRASHSGAPVLHLSPLANQMATPPGTPVNPWGAPAPGPRPPCYYFFYPLKRAAPSAADPEKKISTERAMF